MYSVDPWMSRQSMLKVAGTAQRRLGADGFHYTIFLQIMLCFCIDYVTGACWTHLLHVCMVQRQGFSNI